MSRIARRPAGTDSPLDHRRGARPSAEGNPEIVKYSEDNPKKRVLTIQARVSLEWTSDWDAVAKQILVAVGGGLGLGWLLASLHLV
jgi:hypothetical protein